MYLLPALGERLRNAPLYQWSKVLARLPMHMRSERAARVPASVSHKKERARYSYCIRAAGRRNLLSYKSALRAHA